MIFNRRYRLCACTILLIFLIAVPVAAQPVQQASPDTSFTVASLIFLAGISLDYTTTMLNSNYGEEMNPIGKFILDRTGDEGFLVSGIVYAAGTLLIAKALRKRHPRLACTMLQILGTLHLQAGATNIIAFKMWLRRD